MVPDWEGLVGPLLFVSGRRTGEIGRGVLVLLGLGVGDDWEGRASVNWPSSREPRCDQAHYSPRSPRRMSFLLLMIIPLSRIR